MELTIYLRRPVKATYDIIIRVKNVSLVSAFELTFSHMRKSIYTAAESYGRVGGVDSVR
jgi:hypothetical protein